MNLSQMDRLSVLACVTGLALLAIFFVEAWLGVTRPEWLPVLHLLLLETANPRSVVFQARAIHADLQALDELYGDSGIDRFGMAAERLAALATDSLRPADAALSAALDGLRVAAFRLNDHLTQRFFHHEHGVPATVRMR